MKKTIAICGAFLLAAVIAVGQENPVDTSKDVHPTHTGLDEDTAKPLPMQHEHHGFMQEGMPHAVAKGVTLDAKVDAATYTVTLRVGPMNLPAHTSHMKMPQPPDLVWEVPMDGWLLAYHPKLVDASGNAVPGTVLHHVAFWNENRADFLCPNKEEHIFGAGSEMTDWAEVPGFGYRVQKGEKIRIEQDRELARETGAKSPRQVELTKAELLDEDGIPAETFQTGKSMTLRIHYNARKRVENPRVEVEMVWAADDWSAAIFRNNLDNFQIPAIEGRGTIDLRIGPILAEPNVYQFNIQLGDDTTPAYDQLQRIRFVIAESLPIPGIFSLSHTWAVGKDESKRTTGVSPVLPEPEEDEEVSEELAAK